MGDQESLESVHSVLDQPLLLNKILNYVIHNINGNQDAENVRLARCVKKRWNEEVATVLRTNGKPLYYLTLDEANVLENEDKKILDNFVHRLTTSNSSSSKELMPTFKLKILSNFFRNGNFSSLYNCFEKCSNGLVALKMLFPEDELCLQNYQFPSVALPNLRELQLTLTGNKNSNLDFTNLLQSFLNQNQTLENVALCRAFEPSNRVSDGNILGFRVVVTIRYSNQTGFQPEFKIRKDKIMEDGIKFFIDNPFPNLKFLTLDTTVTLCSEGVLNLLIEKLRNTLTCLILVENKTVESLNLPNNRLLCFPALEKLKVLEIRSSLFELETNAGQLLNGLCKLETLVLHNHNPTQFQKWMTFTFDLTSVRNLDLEILKETGVVDPANLLPRNVMQNFCATFANMRVLNLRVCETVVDDLKHLFMEANQLEDLKLFVPWNCSVQNFVYWDSMLIGVDEEFIPYLIAASDIWNGLTYPNNPGKPCIARLTELRSFQLHESGLLSVPTVPTNENNSLHYNLDNPGTDCGKTLISDLTFKHGLLEMPKLKKLDFNGRFRPSSNMTEEWKRRGGEISYMTY